MSGLISALDIAYEQKESRSFFRFNLVALVLTIGAIIGGIVAIALVGVLPAAVQLIGLGLDHEVDLADRGVAAADRPGDGGPCGAVSLRPGPA